MVEIIGFDKFVMKRCTCRECGAQLLYGKHDINKYKGVDYSGEAYGCEWIVCPSCNNDVALRSW